MSAQGGPGGVSPSHGVTAAELPDRGGHRGKLGARDLERWLVGQGFARRNGGPRLLVPTELGLELGASIAIIGS